MLTLREKSHVILVKDVEKEKLKKEFFHYKQEKKRKNKDENDEDEDDIKSDENYNGNYKNIDPKFYNPLPGFMDPITQEEVVKPAISPLGYVMGYGTWVRILTQEPKNICPFTKQKVTARELVKITPENVDEYFNKIKNMNN